ncbi:MAG: hypothetical protein K6G22_12315, partial [Lachnospiraceae bacterium]|nr:hypothetical protein [Lachnospiraceae bacterium]
MQLLTDRLISGLAPGFFIRQFLVIVLLFAAGLAVNMLIDFFTDSPLFMLTAFPVGLSLYVISGYLLLVTDIGFSFKKMLAALLF